jgi:phosphatidylinositol phospholipase C beta
MSKAYNFDWQIEVAARLLKGDYFDRWDEENGTLEQNCLFRVDSYGFFIYWQSEGRDGQVIELSQVSDIRPGKGIFLSRIINSFLFIVYLSSN